MDEIDYVGYIRLDALRDTVRPLTPGHDASTRCAEHLFIVTHQVAELWLKQALLDLDQAEQALGEHMPDDQALLRADEHVARASHVFDQVVGATAVLTRLPPADFARFRHLLGTASGAQSPQFAEFGMRLGVRGARSSLYERFECALAKRSLSVTDVYRQGESAGIVHQLAEHLVELAQGFQRWQVCHVEIVRGAIGRARGTGGTSGMTHLVERIELPFPRLWAARASPVPGVVVHA